MKKIFFVILSLVLFSCVTSTKLNNVNLGMTKQDVIMVMGKPKSTSSQGNIEYMNYLLREAYGTHNPKYDYYVRLVDGKVESYGKLGDFNSTQDPTININNNSNINTKTTNESKDMYTELKKLKELLDSGIITEDEYNKKKKDILDKY